ncbi:hypothetical protein DUI87_04103 [Hirundo rustica rustica]|uniref:Uncharacterized protein n=1 Tax=Hirundo rustica rustica TaxID=333673 RepID=A0A3M0L353_HIRRU|nr:hypothetical protein DUI87_04103 [Hirundo rustica rustica]
MKYLKARGKKKNFKIDKLLISLADLNLLLCGGECYQNKKFRRLDLICPVARFGELGMFTWKRKGFEETLELLPVPKATPEELERDFAQGPEVRRQRRVALRPEMASLKGIEMPNAQPDRTGDTLFLSWAVAVAQVLPEWFFQLFGNLLWLRAACKAPVVVTVYETRRPLMAKVKESALWLQVGY